MEYSEVLDKRCPFCNNYATLKKIKETEGKELHDYWLIKCKKCPAQMKLDTDNFTEVQAIEFWNRRIK